MFSTEIITENKITSVGALALAAGLVTILYASTINTSPVEGDVDGLLEEQSQKSKKTACLVGASLISLGVILGVGEQAMRKFGSSSSILSSPMSSSDLADFQDRVSKAAANLRQTMSETPSASSMMDDHKSSAELAARASAQISSFIQNYS